MSRIGLAVPFLKVSQKKMSVQKENMKEKGGRESSGVSTSGFFFLSLSPSRKTMSGSVHFKLASIKKDPYKIAPFSFAYVPSNSFSFFL